jgi:hypothetical protein
MQIEKSAPTLALNHLPQISCYQFCAYQTIILLSIGLLQIFVLPFPFVLPLLIKYQFYFVEHKKIFHLIPEITGEMASKYWSEESPLGHIPSNIGKYLGLI